MSRFNQVNALAPRRRDGVSVPQASAAQLSATPVRLGSPAASIPASKPIAPAAPNGLQRACFFVLCVFVVSGFLNEFAMRYLGGKAYVSTVLWYTLPLFLLVSRRPLRGLHDWMGRLWLAFLFWLVLAIPFSVWRGGSVALLRDYVSHGWIQFFYFAAFLVSVRFFRPLIHVWIAADLLMLLDCYLAGSRANGRLEIPDSLFFANANDLSLQLAIALTHFIYLLGQRSIWKRTVAGGAILTTLLFLLQTASRGTFLAVAVLIATIFLISRHRIQIALVTVPLLVVALLFAPSAALHRLTLLTGDYEEGVLTESDESSLASSAQRMNLLRQSVDYAITHPIFGVGPGQFAVAMFGERSKQGKPAPWLGTHNSYTQVASECGIPAMLFYTGVILLALRSNFRIYRHAERVGSTDLAAVALCLFGSTLIYAVSTLFYHIAYSSYLPAISGMSAALHMTVDPSWSSSQAAAAPIQAGPTS